jgi:N-acetylmuramoyl-L-alanine amidase/AmpD protein
MPDGRTGVNDFSIGVELVNRNDGKDPYPEKQLEVLCELLEGILSRHPVRFLVGHYEIAVPYGRKTDPVGLSIEEIRTKMGIR